LLETSALVGHRLGVVALRAFHQDVAPILRVEWITETQHRAGVEALLTAGRKRLSLVDCVSFQLMRESGVREAFCFDQHFREQGFGTIP
jgi:predicted nucleic acid-binding protein